MSLPTGFFVGDFSAMMIDVDKAPTAKICKYKMSGSFFMFMAHREK